MIVLPRFINTRASLISLTAPTAYAPRVSRTRALSSSPPEVWGCKKLGANFFPARQVHFGGVGKLTKIASEKGFLRPTTAMPSTAPGSRAHQNQCTKDERLFIPAFTGHNLRARTVDDGYVVVEFEGCSVKKLSEKSLPWVNRSMPTRGRSGCTLPLQSVFQAVFQIYRFLYRHQLSDGAADRLERGMRSFASGPKKDAPSLVRVKNLTGR